ncbi:DNA-directed RNA polymerase specialized sigma24 family protein [Dysgonomonas alginatilytica]|uniref:DNA-directed RNA polymerase specialized sigma24 family protein n=1 Tax=Dysgonomonas alginatilytica TaxID=1605892 RepID=A0A2V3PHP9_9BACT|nr:sigma-70 family RNA polymerase sigma factor [Dysgonomonas alginatilytica]PXV58794.1 DNA-directed RNA polymerase specialized sigma24 family protein [Dysgonomonas alginatilytica]
MTHNKTRYNYGGCGRDGQGNKGKKYFNYSEEIIATPEALTRCDEFKEWFSTNFENLKINLINKGKYDHDVMVDTFLKIHRFLEYGGVIENYHYYFNTAYFTNEFLQTIKITKENNKNIPIDDFEIVDNEDSEEHYAVKDELINEIGEWLNNNIDNEIDREIFIIYINTRRDSKFKMTYKKLSTITGVPIATISEVISRIKKQLKEEFKIKRLKTL